jgi:hypothetical protein
MQVYSGVIRKASEEKFSYVIIQKRPKASATTSTTASARNTTATTSKRTASSYGKWVESPPAPTYATLAEAAKGGDSPDPTPLTVLERFLGVENEVVPKLVDELIDEVSVFTHLSHSRRPAVRISSIFPGIFVQRRSSSYCIINAVRSVVNACTISVTLGGLGGVRAATAPGGVGTHRQVHILAYSNKYYTTIWPWRCI